MTLLTILTGAPIAPPPPPPPPPPDTVPVGDPGPEPTAVGDLLLERLAPLLGAGQASDSLLRVLCRAATVAVERHAAVARGIGDTDEWVAALTPDRAPADSLVWLAQWTGAPAVAGVTRQQIKDHQVLRRGRPASIRTAVAATLTGGRNVMITERAGSAYRLLVQVYADECPNPPASEAAARSQTPAMVILAFQVLTGQAIGRVEGLYATVGAAEAAYATVGDAESDH